MSRLGHVLLLALPGALLLGGERSVATAQLVEQVRVQADNDNFSFWLHRTARPDYEYTHGTRLSVTSRTARGWGRHLAPGTLPCEGDEPREQACLQTVWELGQQIYTPRTNSAEVVPLERPHAGWLYGAATAVVQRAADRHAVRMEVGVTGPPSLAEFVQVNVHRLGGYWQPRGWHNQLHFEPGVLVGYRYERLLTALAAQGTRLAELVSETGAVVGNVVTGGSVGLNARLGLNVPHSWRGERPAPPAEFSAFLMAGVRADGYVRNLFLDGNTFQEGHHVAKLPLVGQYRLGAAVRTERVEVAYEVVSRTREYRTEPDGHRYSSITVTYRP